MRHPLKPLRGASAGMKIKIRELDVEVTGTLRAHAESRIRLALARFADRVGEVVVRFSDNSAKPYGEGTRCEIDVGLSPRRVRAADEDADVFAAVDRAAARVARSVARALEQERELAELSAGGAGVPRGWRAS